MTVTPAPLPLPDLSPFGGGTWQAVTREDHGTTSTAYRAVMTDPDYLFAVEPGEVCPICNTDCYASTAYGCELCDNGICHACGLAYNYDDLS